MYKLKLLLLPVALLLAFMAFACAPPDDDDRSSGPTINNAIYDFATAILTVQGTHLGGAQQAQIQTITVGSRTNGVALSSYTADDPATGPDSRSLAKGKYRIKSDGTALWLKLTDDDKATLEAKVGSDGLKKGLLTSTGAWAGLNTAKDLEVSNVPENKQSKVSDDNQPSKQTEDEQAEEVEQTEEDEQDEQTEEQSPKQPKDEQDEEESPKQPKDEQVEQAEEESPKAAITRATYDVGTALLTLQGTDLGSATQAQIQTITVDGLALNSYSPDDDATGLNSRGLAKGKYRMHSAGTALWLYLTDTDKTTLNGKDGMDTNGLKKGLLSVGSGAWAGLNTAKALAVSGNPPAITRATYDVNTGKLVITGTNLPSTVYDGWDFSKLRFVAGNGRKSAPLLRHHPYPENFAIGSAGSATSLTITLGGSEKRKADAILVNDGDSDANGQYNLEAAAGFAGGSAGDTTNPITVSGYTARITRATYDANTGQLVIVGYNLPKTVADWDFSKLTLVSGDGKKRYTLPRHSTTGANTATGSRASRVSLTITLSGTVKAEANKILVKNGDSDDNGAYNLEAAAEFAGGRAEDTSNPITVSGYVSLLNTVSYITHRSVLNISGSRLPTAVAEWDFSKLTLVSGDGKKRYTLPRHSTTGANKATGSRASATSLNITLSGIVKAKVEAILVKSGFGDANGAYNLEAAAEFVPGSAEDLTTSIFKL